MSITKERIMKLTEFLNADEERASKLSSLEASVAVEQINSHGHDFTVTELQAYGDILSNVIQLEDNVLEGVAGGVNKSMDDFIPLTSIVAGSPNSNMLVMPVYGVGVGTGIANLWRS